MPSLKINRDRYFVLWSALIGVREGILLGGRKKIALKLTFYFNPNGA